MTASHREGQTFDGSADGLPLGQRAAESVPLVGGRFGTPGPVAHDVHDVQPRLRFDRQPRRMVDRRGGAWAEVRRHENGPVLRCRAARGGRFVRSGGHGVAPWLLSRDGAAE